MDKEEGQGILTVADDSSPNIGKFSVLAANYQMGGWFGVVSIMSFRFFACLLWVCYFMGVPFEGFCPPPQTYFKVQQVIS